MRRWIEREGPDAELDEQRCTEHRANDESSPDHELPKSRS
jgi:hypothetical protein